MISEARDMLIDAIPDLRINVAHGRMGRGIAESNVEDFAEGNADILLATTVIENGIDIPSVNTMIIFNAQSFGMSTLYQLRGRVGRSNKQAFAYFLYPEESKVTETAMLRLKALEDLTDLGSGFDLASRDLEIRGAGSLFGVEQSGMAGKVGFDLYMRMLKKAIKKLGGLALPSVSKTNVTMPNGEGSVSGENLFKIPSSYIEDEDDNARMVGEARLADNSEKLVALTEEWKAKYGVIPVSMRRPLKDLHLHSCTRLLGIDSVTLDDENGAAILRAPGLRPRHWRMIEDIIKGNGGRAKAGISTNFQAYFPPRMLANDEKESEEKANEDAAADDFTENLSSMMDKGYWDEYDEEENYEGDNDSMTKFLERDEQLQIPSFTIKGIKNTEEGKRADALLKILLPVANLVLCKQKEDAAATLKMVEAKEQAAKYLESQKGPIKKTRNGYYEIN